ncbi:glutamate-5-semialdehyde dehydrogenase [Pelagibacteraceae bacterium]|nr:glutamate-5-semialdehyde dehydrogenase [Pelagibacteraceae bacterium]
MKNIFIIGRKSKQAFENLKKVNHKRINKALDDYIKLILINKKKIIKENAKDVKRLKRKNLLDRLILNEKKIKSIIKSIKDIKKFPNPIGKTLDNWTGKNKLNIKRVTTPIGVIGIIYESRPNVTADVAALCLKSSNCAILRGGSEAFYSNKILSNLFRKSLKKNKIDQNCLQFIENKNRKIVDFLLSKMSKYVDVIVPRGGKGLVAKVQKYSNVHVIGHLEGLCHIYLDKENNLNNAIKVIINAKMRRTSICGALETLLINEKILKTKGIKVINSLVNHGCEVVVDKKINRLFNNNLKLAKELDWSTEYLDAKLSIKSVKDVKEAVSHVLKYGTMHTDCIISNNKKNALFFLNSVNSSIAMHNVSTQFADGGEFGFGGEIGISTNKLPPRGPVGLNQLTSYKYIVKGKSVTRP